MRLIIALISMLALGGQTYPVPYPRAGVKPLIDNARAQVWDVSWPKGDPPGIHRHLYDMTGLYYWPGDRRITQPDGSTALLSLVAVAGQSPTLPPPFPRPNAVKMLENDRVQVWSVAWPKGQPTPLHRHIYDITGTYTAAGDRLITDADGSKRPVTNAAGGIVWQFKGLTHIEEGTSDSPLRAVMIELKGDGPSGKVVRQAAAPAFSGDAKPRLDNDRVVVWDYSGTAPPVQHAHVRDTVVVWTDGGEGRAIFLAAGTVHTPEPISAGAKATIFELK